MNSTYGDSRCRVCIVRQDSLVSLKESLSNNEISLTIAEVLQVCSSIRVSYEDLKPQHICVECTNKAIISYKFKILCESSNTILENELRDNENIKYEENDQENSTDVSYISEEVKINESEVKVNDKSSSEIVTSTAEKEEITFKVNPHFFDDDSSDNCVDYDNIYSSDHSENESDKYSCEICKRMFKHQTARSLHSKLHGDTNTECGFCKYVSNIPERLEKHLKSCKGMKKKRKRQSCVLCKNTFATIKEFKKHECNTNLKVKDEVITCDFCGKEFTNFKRLQTHKATHRIPEKTCKFCNALSGTFEECVQHLIEVHPEEAGQETETETTQCVLCKLDFKSELDIARHRIICKFKSEDRESRICIICNKIFDTKRLMLKHEKTHDNERCRYCEYFATESYNLVEHIKTHHVEEIEDQKDDKEENGQDNKTCPVCSKSFAYRRLMLEHWRSHRLSQKTCQFCDFSAETFETLADHLEIEHYEMATRMSRAIGCKNCDDLFNSELELVKHRIGCIIKKAIDEEKMSSTCQVCNKVLKTLKCLKEHMKKHHNNKACKYCDFVPIERGDLYKHMEEHHKDKKNIICSVCGKSFYRKENLRAHVVLHSGVRKYTCDICGVSFTLSSNLNAHKKIHTGLKDFKCTKCGKGFVNRQRLKSHLITHSNERDHICSQCGATFKRRASYWAHWKRHTNHRPFPCRMCDKAFRTNVELKRHIDIHMGVKNYECSVCHRTFNRSNTLKVHMRIHTGETPYMCDHCGRSFIQAAALICHLKRHEKPVNE